MDFNFCCPTKIYFKNEGVSSIGEIISQDYNFKKVYLVYGGNSLKKIGAYSKIINSLKDNHIEFKEYGGISFNPDIEDVKKMVDEVKAFHPDLILACGGGSVLDASKSVAHGYYYEGNPLDFNKHLVKPLHALPVATILTLSASGSEMSDSCVISDRKHNFKSGFNSQTNYPLFSLMDPSLTLSVPPYQVGVGLADMFSHSFERYFSPSSEIEPSDYLALGIMKAIVKTSYEVIAKPDDVEARRNMMICGTLAHNGITSYGKNKRFIVHKAEHILSGFYPELVHGQGIALLMPLYLEMNKCKYKDKILEMGKSVFSMKSTPSLQAVIDVFKDWLNTLPIYHSFDELPFKIDEKAYSKAIKILKVN